VAARGRVGPRFVWAQGVVFGSDGPCGLNGSMSESERSCSHNGACPGPRGPCCSK